LGNNSFEYYHGSYDELSIGTILRPRDDYDSHWYDLDCKSILEKYRPANQLPFSQVVFMCDNVDDIDNAGGATDYIYLVKPVGQIWRHDVGWQTAITIAMENNPREEDLKSMADHYWQGLPNHQYGPVWEYCARGAVIVEQV
jgi:hypothetical protein